MRIDLKTILKYLKGELSHKEEHHIEREALDDPFLSDAIEGFEKFEVQEIESDIKELKDGLKKKDTAFPWYSIAASILIVFVAGYSIWFLSNEKTDNLAFEEIPVVNEEVIIPNQEFIKDSIREFKSDREINESRNSGVEDKIDERPDEVVSKPELAEIKNSLKESRNEEVDAIPEVENELDFEIEVADVQLEEEVIELGMQLSEDISENAAVKSISGEEIAQRSKREMTRSSYNLPEPSAMPNIASSYDADEIDDIRVEGKQVRIITGKITGENGEGVPGVNILVEGTTRGVMSDVTGEFSISLFEDEKELQISSIGYVSQRIDLDEDKDYVIVMLSEDVSTLSEVVVTGYAKAQSYQPVEILPQPDGGLRALRQYVKENQVFPDGIDEDKALVKLLLTVSASGKITSIEVEKSEGEFFDKEAIRLLKAGPSWNPGTVDGNPTEMEVKVRIKFKK
ncbi:carboxypeptidase-like regulatory domain-containing protein [Marinigracilibium pacificum]|uniref:TonB C-terminal domain-containing protein n=1 Tax=Marinigracilibium pacificum TaxID=2729599 RepID=A0A848J383_9BACT|nr:carboxypeptidase-like regulatory domain-containing protein [Marinigracilibium pacificum]NMM48944.1 hypothetical protein [Marinigracilibium pacificum]